MHDGAFPTLDAVVANYNRGGSVDGVGPRSVQLRPLLLTDAEQGDLVNFLHSLTGAPLPAALTSSPELPP
jgi:cytochrome c peroxidase